MPRHTARTAILGAALITAALTACSSGTTTTTASAPAPTTPAASPSTTAPSSAPATPTTAASSAGGNSALAAWYTATGKERFHDFDVEGAQLHADGTSALSADSTDCSEIDSTQGAAAQEPAPPDPSIATAWKNALDQIHQGTFDCNGGKQVGLTELGAGLSLMDTVKAEVQSAIGA